MSYLAATEMTLGELSWKSKANGPRYRRIERRGCRNRQRNGTGRRRRTSLARPQRKRAEESRRSSCIIGRQGAHLSGGLVEPGSSDGNRAAHRAREATVPDIIVNNAGFSGQWKFLDETTPKEIQDMMAVPYFAAAWLTRAFLPAMRARNSGHIVNIS